MSKQFFSHIKRFADCTEEDFAIILSYFQLRNLDKKEIVMEAGKLCRYNFFVLKGCMHMYYINDKGIEKTVKLAIENWWISDYLAFHHQQQTDFYIQAVETTQVLCIDYDRQAELLAKFPQMETYFRNIYEIGYGASIMRIKFQFEYSKEEMFLRFEEQFPEFVQRVPQYLLATYLGLTPEYLSEVRRKKQSSERS